MQDRYETGQGRQKDMHFLSPKSRRILEGMGAKPDELDPVAGVEREDTIRMRTPDGKLWDIPRSKAEEARKRGATEVR